MTDLRARLADALADHMTTFNSCLCGEDDFTFADDWGRHLADVLLSLPGIAIIELPEVQASGLVGQTEWPVKSRDDGAVVTIRLSDHKIVNDGVSNPYSSPEAARSHAAALLAAANAAEDADD